jgi:hypothetical protein
MNGTSDGRERIDREGAGVIVILHEEDGESESNGHAPCYTPGFVTATKNEPNSSGVIAAG